MQRPLAALCLVALCSLVPAPRAAAYTTNDMIGTWTTHALGSGPLAPWWERAVAQAGAGGALTVYSVSNAGERDTMQGTLQLSPTGILTLVGDTEFRGALDLGKTAFASTEAWMDFGEQITVLRLGVKRVGGYVPSDLAGNWEINSIASGPGQPWWMRGRIAIAPDGSFAGSLTDSEGSTDPASGTFVLLPDGSLTISVASLALGTLDAGHTVFAMTNTWSGFAAGTSELTVGLKMAPTYTQAQLAGTWEMHTLATGPGAPWYSRGQLTVASNGAYSGTITENSGGSFPVSGTFTLASNGVLSRSGSTVARGALDAGRTVMVWTDTWATGAPGTTEMLIGVRTGGATTDAGDSRTLALALEPVRPNPVRAGALTVRFALASDAAARIELLDVAGRIVATRDVGSLGAGAHAVDLGGAARARPGLYFVRLVQGATERVGRVLLID